MCDYKPGLRCSPHALQTAAVARGLYTTAHPDGPQVHPLTGARETLAQMNAERVVARREARRASRMLRSGELTDEQTASWTRYRDQHLEQDAVALDRMQGVRAQREATRAAEMAKLAAAADAEQAQETPPVIPHRERPLIAIVSRIVSQVAGEGVRSLTSTRESFWVILKDTRRYRFTYRGQRFTGAFRIHGFAAPSGPRTQPRPSHPVRPGMNRDRTALVAPWSPRFGGETYEPLEADGGGEANQGRCAHRLLVIR